MFAALDIATGEVIGRCYDRHRHEEFLDFLKLIDKQIPKGQQVHIILDNYATHENVKNWLVKHPRFHFHFTPTSSSWLNLVERWFRNITDNMITRGVFPNVKDLITKINAFVTEYNKNPKPYIGPRQPTLSLKRSVAVALHSKRQLFRCRCTSNFGAVAKRFVRPLLGWWCLSAMVIANCAVRRSWRAAWVGNGCRCNLVAKGRSHLVAISRVCSLGRRLFVDAPAVAAMMPKTPMRTATASTTTSLRLGRWGTSRTAAEFNIANSLIDKLADDL